MKSVMLHPEMMQQNKYILIKTLSNTEKKVNRVKNGVTCVQLSNTMMHQFYYPLNAVSKSKNI